LILVIINSNQNLFNCLIDNYNVFMYNLIEIKKKMKKVLFAIVMVGALVAACNNSTETTTVDSTVCDSVMCDSMKCINNCDSVMCDSVC